MGYDNKYNKGNGGSVVKTRPADIPMSPATLAAKQQVNQIQDLMSAVMRSGEHYGTIPGCGNKPTLLKSGAEKILSVFNLGIEPIVDCDRGEDAVTYSVRCRVFNISDGNTVGFGVGVCSSLEEKYRWRKAVCEGEFNATPETDRRVKFANGRDGEYTVKQVKVSHFDVANTVLKMAKKRALVDAVLTATAASDCFTQDLEDWDKSSMPPLENDDAPANNAAPKAPPTQEQKAIQSASVEDIKSALEQLGLKSRVSGSFVAAEDGDSTVFQKKDALKDLGFRYKADTKVWYRKAA